MQNRVFLLIVTLFATLSAADLEISHRSRADQPGEILLLELPALDGVEAVEARAFGRTFSFFEVDSGWRGLVGVDLETEPGEHFVELRLTTASGTRTLEYPIAIEGKSFPVRQLKVAPKFVNPPESELERIRRESRRVREIFARHDTPRLWQNGFVRPVPGKANSSFGKRSVFNGQPRSPHTGTDFRAAAGTPVKAPNRGRVVLADHLYYAGKTVVIDHGQGLYSYLAHLSEIEVEEGSLVERGEVVGKAGATGRVTGPHLHWTLRLAESRVDPLSLLAIAGE